ncbi:MAG: YtaP [Verrucomicrobiales bacterium]|nr:YtaP [Verrucomicrobiales bacterium]
MRFLVKPAILLLLTVGGVMSQTNVNYSKVWMEHAHKVPELKIPSDVKQWEQQRAGIRAQLWKLLGNLPPRPKVPVVKTISREDRGDYFLEKFEFDNGAGATVPGYLFLPKNVSGKAPAILYNHWHGGEYAIGKEEVFHKVHTPEEPGPTFAKRGYVLLAIDAYCFGERNGRGPTGAPNEKGSGELSASKFQLWYGRCLWGMIVRDDEMALDYLLSRPEVDTNNVGVTGMSMGSTRSWWLMALDDRIKTSVNVACFTRYQNILEHDAMLRHGIYYFVPGMLEHFDTEAVVCNLAPRPALFMTGDADGGSPIDGIRVLESKAKEAYAVYGKADNFQSIVYPGLGHVYLPEMWQKTLAWMDGHLKGK